MDGYVSLCYTLLPKVLNMSLTAGVVILFVMAARLLLKKLPKIYSYALWAVVLFRLLCPVSITSQVSVLGLLGTSAKEGAGATSTVEYIPSDIVHSAYPEVSLPGATVNLPGISEMNEQINEVLPQGREQLAADPMEAPMVIGTYIWIAGILVMLGYSIVSHVTLRRKLVGAAHLRDNIYLADHIASPFVMGLLRPRIYLLSSLEDQEQEYIILHEQHHIRRRDHVIKAVAFAALCIHWFNPLVWAAFVLSGKDMEMSCDEAVVRKMGEGIRADYSTSLLHLATGQRIPAGMPLAFGEGDTKGRIRNLANWKKPGIFLTIAAALVCVTAVVVCAVNPKAQEDDGTVAKSKMLAASIDAASADIGTAEAGDVTQKADGTGIDQLEAAVSAAILEQNQDRYSENFFRCESHIIFETEYAAESALTEKGEYDQYVTVYALVLHQIYDLSGGAISDEGGSHIPTAITFGIDKEGKYALLEYWKAKDGSYYESSIRDKFPRQAAKEAMDTQKYVLTQIQDCYAQVIQYGKMDTDGVVAGLLDEILENPGTASGVQEYIDANSIVFRELTYYGAYTLKYCFREFLKGGQTDLRGLLMARACQEIMTGIGDDLLSETDPATGQEWFNAYYAVAKSREERYTQEEIKVNYPVSRMLLEMAEVYAPNMEPDAPSDNDIDWEALLKQYLENGSL